MVSKRRVHCGISFLLLWTSLYSDFRDAGYVAEFRPKLNMAAARQSTDWMAAKAQFSPNASDIKSKLNQILCECFCAIKVAVHTCCNVKSSSKHRVMLHWALAVLLASLTQLNWGQLQCIVVVIWPLVVH